MYWQNKEYKRDSDDYQLLLNRAYNALNKNSSFRKALLSTQNAKLTHNIGKNKKNETVLTRNEFCSRLTFLRDNEELKENM